MKSFFYSLRQVFKLRLPNLFKVLSLTLGIAIGGFILCWSAYQNSYDRWIPNHQNVGFLLANWTIGGGEQKLENSIRTQGPVAPELMNSVPTVIKATRTQGVGALEFKVDDKAFQLNSMFADSLFFDVIGIKVLSGDPHQIFANSREVMLSRSAAKKIFSSIDVVGKELLYGENKLVYTVSGVYEDIPNNSHMGKYELMLRGRFKDYWDGGDSYFTYFTVPQGTDLAKLSDEINIAFAPKLETMITQGFSITYNAIPVTMVKGYMDQSSGAVSVAIMVLALMILLVSALNFALLEISSLVSRAKEVGVHKVSGATTFEVFMLVIWETIIYTILGVILAVGLIYALRGDLEGLTDSFNDIFTASSLWVIASVLISMVVVAGVLPAILFCRISAMEVFRKFRGNNLWWKQALLFIQFTLSVMTVSLLVLTSLQYNLLINFDLGYKYDNLSVIYMSESVENSRQTLKNELQGLSYVEAVTISEDPLTDGWSGIGVHDTRSNEMLISARGTGIDEDFFSTYGIEVLEGDPKMIGERSAFVNHRFQIATNSKIGDDWLMMEEWTPIGVFAEFRGNLYSEPLPMILYKRYVGSRRAVITIRTTGELTSVQKSEIEALAKKIFPTKDYTVSRYNDVVESSYSELRFVRNMIFVGSLVLIIILVLGMVSYISTDIKARQREIAIRRTHGATTMEIIVFVARRIFIVAGVSSLVAIIGVYFVSQLMLSFFAEKVEVGFMVYASGVLFAFALIFISTYIQTWKIARRDYVRIIGKA